MKNSKTIYKFPNDGLFGVKLPENILRITVSSDGSVAIISTPKKLTLLYFRKLFSRMRPKHMLKQEYCDLYKNIGPIEMHPFFDEKEYLAGAYENNIFVVKVSKNSLNITEAKKFTSQHHDNIRFIAWQYKQHGLLASTSSDKVINLYDILRTSKNPFSKIIDDDIVKSIKFSYACNSYLATGYDKVLKIWDIQRSLTTPIIKKEIFDYAVDILDWHFSHNHLLCGSKQGNIIKIFSVKEQLDFLFEIKIKDVDDKYDDQKIIKAYFMPGNGIVAVCEKKAFIYHTGLGGYEATIDQIVEFECTISNFKIMTSTYNNNFFVYTDKENNFISRLYTFDESLVFHKSYSLDRERGLQNTKKLFFLKEIENIKKLYPFNVAVETRTERSAYTFKLMKDLTLIRIKITFRDNYPKMLPLVEFENKNESFTVDKALIHNINKEISKWEELHKYHQEPINETLGMSFGLIEKLISDLLLVINKHGVTYDGVSDDYNSLSKFLFKSKGKNGNESQTILPYVRTCSFAWNPNGQIIMFQYNKVDFKQLKERDKMISNFNNLEDWIKFCQSKDEKNKFSRTDNKLIEEEGESIVAERLKDLVNWTFSLDIDDSVVVNYVNRVESLPNLFISLHQHESQKEQVIQHLEAPQLISNQDLSSKEHSTNEMILMENVINGGEYSRLKSYVNYKNINEVSNNDQEESISIQEKKEGQYHAKSMTPIHHLTKKKSIISLHQLDIESHEQFEMNIIRKLKIKLLSRDHFFASINYLLQTIKSPDIVYLTDILNLINYNINSIIDPSNSSELLVRYYKLSIMTTIKTLEKNKKFEFLYIAILLITSRIFDDMINSILSNRKDIPDEELKRPTVIYFKNEYKSRKNGNQSLSSLKSDQMMNKSHISHGLGQKCQLKSQINLNKAYRPGYRLSQGKAGILCKSSSFEGDDDEGSVNYTGLFYDENSEKDGEGKFSPLKASEMLNMTAEYVAEYTKNNLNNTSMNANFTVIQEQETSENPVNQTQYGHDTSFDTQRDLILIFGEAIICKFLDYLYYFSNELYRMNHMIERAELIKFLYIVCSKLKINSKIISYVNTLELKKVIQSTYENIHPTVAKSKKNQSGIISEILSINNDTSQCLYNRYIRSEGEKKKNIFKTKMISDDFVKCFYCGERLKIGTFSVICSGNASGMAGHLHHILAMPPSPKGKQKNCLK